MTMKIELVAADDIAENQFRPVSRQKIEVHISVFKALEGATPAKIIETLQTLTIDPQALRARGR